jgi:hypothetical protein
MKAGLAAMTYAAVALRESELPFERMLPIAQAVMHLKHEVAAADLLETR